MNHVRPQKYPLGPLSEVTGRTGFISDGDWVESKDQDPNGDVRLIQLADVGVGTYVNKSARFLTSEKANKLRCTSLNSGDILVARMPDPIGRACIFPGDIRKAVTVVDVCVIRPDPAICDARWLCWTINSTEFLERVQGLARGATRQRIARTELEKIFIAIPPLHEQRRIAAILDQADALRAKRREALAKLDEMAQAIFEEMFGDPISNSQNWKVAPLGSVCKIERGKFTPRPRNDPGYYGGVYPFIQTGDISACGGRLTKWTQTLNEKGKKVSRSFGPGTVVIAIVGATLGVTAILEIEAYCPDSVIGLEVLPAKATPEYVHRLLQLWRPIFVSQAPDTARANMNLESLRPLQVPIPPIDLQQSYSNKISALEVLRFHHNAGLAYLDSLFSSLQHRAFSGEL